MKRWTAALWLVVGLASAPFALAQEGVRTIVLVRHGHYAADPKADGDVPTPRRELGFGRCPGDIGQD